MTSVAPILTLAEPFACHEVHEMYNLKISKKNQMVSQGQIIIDYPNKCQLIKAVPEGWLQFQQRWVDKSISFYHHNEDLAQYHLGWNVVLQEINPPLLQMQKRNLMTKVKCGNYNVSRNNIKEKGSTEQILSPKSRIGSQRGKHGPGLIFPCPCLSSQASPICDQAERPPCRDLNSLHLKSTTFTAFTHIHCWIIAISFI